VEYKIKLTYLKADKSPKHLFAVQMIDEDYVICLNNFGNLFSAHLKLSNVFNNVKIYA